MHPYIKYAPFFLLSFLPLPLIYLLADLIYLPLYYLIGYRKKVVRQNLRNAFPAYSPERLKQIEKDFYKHFCSLFLESMKVLSIRPSKAVDLLQISNQELLDEYHKAGKNVVMYSAHFGNWEWFAFMPLLVKHQFVSFYQEQSNAYFNGLSIHMRERFGNICVESRLGYKKLMEIQNSGKLSLAYMISDQSPMQQSSKIWTDFLNQRTAFLVGPDRIAKKSSSALIYPHISMPKRGRYKIELKEIQLGESEQVVAAYARMLEANITESPALWLWTHRRWKLKED